MLNGVSFDIDAGEIVGLIGESGSGKSTIVRSIIGLLEKNARIDSGTISVVGRHISAESDYRVIRGRHVGTVFQDTGGSLNPLMRIGRQLREVVNHHAEGLAKRARAERIRGSLARVGFSEEQVERVLRAYPHQLSGGMRQRVAVALAVVTEPELVIADECTSALDVTTQADVVRLLRTLVNSSDRGMLFVTHDLALASSLCSRLVVLNRGRVVEVGATEDVISRPAEAYTQALLAAGRSL